MARPWLKEMRSWLARDLGAGGRAAPRCLRRCIVASTGSLRCGTLRPASSSPKEFSTDALPSSSAGFEREASIGPGSSAPILEASDAQDTIAAIVSGGPSCSVGIVRISGPRAVHILKTIFVRTTSRKDEARPSAASRNAMWEPTSHRVYHGHLVQEEGEAGEDGRPVPGTSASGAQQVVVDEVLAIPMLGKRSYTAEDVVEFQTHGGSICTRRVLDCCTSLGARVAKPGEFTYRAFMNGRLDLTQAEAVAGVINARTVEAADAALAGLDGGLRHHVEAMRTKCIHLLARVDAHIDYEDEMEPLNTEEIHKMCLDLKSDALDALRTAKKGQYLETGLTVALIGAPNVGKSSLLNAMSGAERAIVTEIAGTTRDIVEASTVFSGVPTKLLDTAGIRDDVSDIVEELGVRRSTAAARAADIVLMVVNARLGWGHRETQIMESLLFDSDETTQGPAARMPPIVLVFNQVDAVEGLRSGSAESQASPAALEGMMGSVPDHILAGMGDKLGGDVVPSVLSSAVTGEGLGEVQEQVMRIVGLREEAQASDSGVWHLNTRQASCLEACKDRIDELIVTVEEDWPLDCCAVHLRGALQALNELTGSDVTEDVLNSIFSQFCIGK